MGWIQQAEPLPKERVPCRGRVHPDPVVPELHPLLAIKFDEVVYGWSQIPFNAWKSSIDEERCELGPKRGAAIPAGPFLISRNQPFFVRIHEHVEGERLQRCI